MEWISVNEKMPPDGRVVIAAHQPNRGVFPAKCSISEKPMLTYWKDLEGQYRSVTHWMPMPDPPSGN